MAIEHGPLTVGLPIQDGDFPVRYVSLLEGNEDSIVRITEVPTENESEWIKTSENGGLGQRDDGDWYTKQNMMWKWWVDNVSETHHVGNISMNLLVLGHQHVHSWGAIYG